jgi:hypothetical protein
MITQAQIDAIRAKRGADIHPLITGTPGTPAKTVENPDGTTTTTPGTPGVAGATEWHGTAGKLLALILVQGEAITALQTQVASLTAAAAAPAAPAAKTTQTPVV